MFALITTLPRDSALAASLQGQAFGWTNTEELLALVAELIDLNNRLFIQANSKPGSSRPKPIEIPRPNATPVHTPTPTQASREQIERFFKGHIKRKQ